VLLVLLRSAANRRRNADAEVGQSAGHPTNAPADVTTSGSSNADAVHPVHTRPTCFADGNDRPIRLLNVRAA
jgi:hypothetical protein